MPKTKSAQKALRSSERKRNYNLEIKRKLKSLIKKIKKEGKKQDFKNLISLLDKAASKNIIHKNKAARLKSRLARWIAKEKERETKIKKKRKVKRRRGA